MNKRILYFIVVIGVGLVLYLSWTPLPKMGLVWFIPQEVAQWADEQKNENLRTAVPFVLLGLLLGAWLAWQNQRWARWGAVWVALIVLAFLAETGQLLLANRSFDVHDIAWAATGAGAGMGAIAVINGFLLTARRMSSSPA